MATAAKAGAASPREHAAPARKTAAPKSAAPEPGAQAGNQAVQRLLGMDRTQALAQATAAGDAAEGAADRLAARGATRGERLILPDAAHGVRAAGAPLAPALRAGMERHFGADLGGVRVHTDGAAAHAAQALGARAFTYGHDIVFGAGRYAPDSRSGRRLLAHELAHALRPAAHAPLMRDPIVPGKVAPPGGDAGGGDKATDPKTEDDYLYVVDVPNPSLDPHQRARDDDKQQIAIHTKKDGVLHLHYYVVPADKLKPPAAGATPAKAPPAAPATPPPTPAADPNAPAAVPSHPDFPAGSKATLIDGSKVIEVLASTPEHVITAEYVKFAVGAASTSAVTLEDGTAMIIDAGINNANMGMTEKALSKLTLDKLAEFIRDRPVREFLISHAHDDHTSLAPEILRRFPVDTIRINSVQKRWTKYKQLRQELIEQQELRLKETFDKFKREMEAERAKWVEETGRKFAADQRQIEWDKHIESEFKERAKTHPEFRRARERVLVQAKSNVLDVRDFDLVPGRQAVDPAGDSERVEFKAEDPLRIGETQGPIKNKDVLDQRKNVDDSRIDPNASSYVVDMPNGRRLIVMPDLRANNMKKLMDNFGSLLTELNKNNKGTQIRVQQWDIGHHMQKGWSGSAVSASQFGKIVNFLSRYALKKGSDFVVVSAEANLSNPNAPTLVDPANIYLLRSLGFEVYLATSGRDIRVIDITTSQGNKVTGVIGAKAPGEGPPELTIKRAKMALDEINAKLQTERLASPDAGAKKKKGGKKAPERTPSDEEIAAEQARQARVKNLETLRDEIDKAYKDALGEIAELSKAPAGSDKHTTKSLDDAAKREFPKQKRLDELLEKHAFDKPETTTDLRLTDMALVVLKQDIGKEPPPPGSAAARAHELAQSRSRVLELQASMKAAEAITPEMQIELVAELTRYRKIIEHELNPADPKQTLLEGTSRTVLEDELTSTKATLEKLGAAETQTQFKRDVESGILAEQEVIVLKPPEMPQAGAPSKAVQTTAKALEGFGRAMGVVMVVTTIHGQLDLIERLKNKQANMAEGVLGTTHNLLAGAVAVRMVRGLHVGPGAMVALAVLDIATVASRDYDTEEERNVEIAYSAISNSVNLGLMAAGMAIAKIPHPVTMIAGTLLAFAGPWILEKLGVHAWLERKLGFDPASVTQVKQTLRDLMTKYKTIIGSIELAKRTADLNDSSVVGDRKAIKDEAIKTVHDQRLEAAKLEREIMDEFGSAYEDAQGTHTGLKELDQYRAWFMSLRFRAGLADTGVLDALEQENIQAHADPDKPDKPPPPRLVLTPDEVDNRFAEMDAKLQVPQTTDSVEAMKVWDTLDSELDDLEKFCDWSTNPEHDQKYAEHQRKVQTIIDNAYYRLDPRAQGTYRADPMFQSGPAREAYVAKLKQRQSRFLRLQHVHVVNLRARNGAELAGPDLIDEGVKQGDATVGIEAVMQVLENALGAYATEFESGENPGADLAQRLVTDSGAAAEYRTFVANHAGYAAKLKQLKVEAETIDSLFDQAKYLIAEETDTQAQKVLRERYNKAELNRRTFESERTDKLGIYFDSELDSLSSAALKREVERVAPLFGDQAKVKALTEEELTALIKHEGYAAPGVNFLPPLATRLGIIQGGLGVDAYGNINNVFRLTGAVDQTVPGGFIHHTFPWPIATPQMNALVGGVGRGYHVEEGTWMTVVPLNDAAIRFFGGYIIWDVREENLLPMNVELLEHKKAHPDE